MNELAVIAIKKFVKNANKISKNIKKSTKFSFFFVLLLSVLIFHSFFFVIFFSNNILTLFS